MTKTNRFLSKMTDSNALKPSIQKADAQIECESLKIQKQKKLIGKIANASVEMKTYLENCIHISLTVCLAELLRRILLFFSEYWFYGKRYLPDQRVLHIFKRVFYDSKLFYIAFLLLVFFEMALHHRSPMPPAKFLLYMPLYWAFQASQLSHTNLDYATFIRAHHGLDYGEGMASSYFHGFLSLVLPAYKDGPGIRERVQLYQDQEQVEFLTNRLVILIPTTMYTPPKIESRILERAAALKVVRKNRAGVERPYQNDVYRFTVPINKKNYYIALEGATPLLTFYEAVLSKTTSTWQMEEFQREILLKFYQSLQRILGKSPETKYEAELIFYDTKKPDGSPVDVGEYLKEYFEKQLSLNNHDNDE